MSRLGQLLPYLSSHGEEAAAVGVHEDELGPVVGVGAVRVDSEDDLSVVVVHGEAVAGEEKRGFGNGEEGFFFEHERRFHKPFFHLIA